MTDPRDPGTHRHEPNRLEPNRLEPNRHEPNRLEPGGDDVDLSLGPVVIHEVPDIDPNAPVPSDEKAPRTLKGAAVLSARLVAGLAGAAVAAGVVAAAVVLPLPGTSVEPEAVTVTPAAAQQQRVCAGPLLRLGDETGAQATMASAVGQPTVTEAAIDGEVTQGSATDALGADAASTIVTLDSDQGEQGLLAASQFQDVARGDLAGTAAAECLEARDDIWLVGGSTTTGRTSLLTIVNPGEVAAIVEISVFSDAGPVSAPGTSGIVIAPGEQRVYSLAGLTPGLTTPVVRVQSEGALVTATLQQSTVRTLEPGGLDIVTAAAEPSTEVTIPGIVLPDHDALESAIAGEDFLDLNPALRMFVPGEAQAHAVITMIPVSRAGDIDSQPTVDISVTLDPGRVTELPISEFDEGRFVAVITSDVPLVAGVRVAAIGSTGGNDFAWLSSVDALRERALAPIAAGANPVMTLFNPLDQEQEITLEGEASDRSVTVPARSARSIAVAEGEQITLDSFEAVRVGVDYVGDGSITAHSVSPRAPGATPIVIYP